MLPTELNFARLHNLLPTDIAFAVSVPAEVPAPLPAACAAPSVPAASATGAVSSCSALVALVALDSSDVPAEVLTLSSAKLLSTLCPPAVQLDSKPRLGLRALQQADAQLKPIILALRGAAHQPEPRRRLVRNPDAGAAAPASAAPSARLIAPPAPPSSLVALPSSSSSLAALPPVPPARPAAASSLICAAVVPALPDGTQLEDFLYAADGVLVCTGRQSLSAAAHARGAPPSRVVVPML